jgi:hypothetical protein
MFLLSGSMHLSLEVLFTVGADEEVSPTEMERIRLLAHYIQETERSNLLFSTVIILFILILFYISVHLSKVQEC